VGPAGKLKIGGSLVEPKTSSGRFWQAVEDRTNLELAFFFDSTCGSDQISLIQKSPESESPKAL
jgi:hypothetical protein